jgi:anti-sigma factor RsiW
MRCSDVAERLLTDEPPYDSEVEAHVADCGRCARVSRGLQRLDRALSASLLLTPPPDLQRTLAQLVVEAARPAPSTPWWKRLPGFDLRELLGQRPQLVWAQGLAAVALALASWQVFGWVNMLQPYIGDPGYAIELVAGSPAAAYLGSIQIDLQSLSLWSVVGVVGWLLSEAGPIGRRLASTRLRLP